MKHSTLLLTSLLLLSASALPAAEDRKERVLSDRRNVTAAGLWIYNDLDKGFAEAKATGKPLLVVLRCVP